jgi:hypothetical protein
VTRGPLRLGAGAIAIALGVVAGAAPAGAACPPLRGAGTWLEQVARQHQGRTTPLSPQEINDFLQRENIAPFTVTPALGPAPLTVSVTWLWFPVEPPARAREDGGSRRAPQPPRRSDRPGEAGPLLDTAQPGRYDFTVWIHEPGGRVRRLASPVEVVSQADFDRELSARWNDLRDALRRGDATAALQCVHSDAQRRYQSAFTTLAGSVDVDRMLPPIRFVRQHANAAIYEMVRDSRSFQVRFVIDSDGVWRLESM